MKFCRVFKMGREEESAYELTLRRLLDTHSHFSSWEAMIAEEEDPSLSSSRVCTFCPAAPEWSLLEVWLLAATAEHPRKNIADLENTSDEAAGRRWTRFLGLWISLRLAGLIASRDTKSDAFWTMTHREIESYEQCFLYTAWPLLDVHQRLRLRSRIARLRKSCQKALPQLNTSSKADSDTAATAVAEDDGYESACFVLCNSAMRAAQCVAREYLRITWDILDPKQIPEVVDSRLRILFSTPQLLQQRNHEYTTTASALAASGVVHTNCMTELLPTLQRTHLQDHTADHTYRVWMRAVRTALLQIGYNLVVKTRAAMIDFCYFLVPALMDFEACVMLCEVMEREKASTAAAANGAAAPGDAEESEKRRQLRRTMAALLQATQDFYEDTIDDILVGYRKNCIRTASPPRQLTATAVEAPANPLAPCTPPAPPKGFATSNPSFRGTLPTSTTEGGSEAAQPELSLSREAYVVLIEVVEPTCDLLRRYPAETNFQQKEPVIDVAARRKSSGNSDCPEHPQGQDGCCGNAVHTTGEDAAPSTSQLDPSPVKQSFVTFFERKVAGCFTDALYATRSRSASAKVQEQAVMDAHLVSTYLSAALRR
ncbi:hypothetical protein ABB37_00577 [Leptomonas pyrrhocoris]|uniref:Uncharacterized protein n=1 Tax=Leptomonas pyrrhocoris TaxID=157538 RepID=A0A0N1J5H2_LEPPY|nr:hypothetical protein ABB37_00577 [Leptomonas pyrrhocoris]KPA86394.1 hypothetical protein ABB37_00577 [Leptomonas pyrrhocoris]|eukprot:XP_015664833.1 hypothetical protein ABB37_00577 [Leptomonas pyrrhocoris]